MIMLGILLLPDLAVALLLPNITAKKPIMLAEFSLQTDGLEMPRMLKPRLTSGRCYVPILVSCRRNQNDLGIIDTYKGLF
jgi:hypothetical protein